MRADAARMHDVYGSFGISVFALRGATIDELAQADVPHAALVVDDRYSSLFKLTRVRPASVAEQLAEAAVRYPSVPIVFAETRQLAQEWTYRFFGAAVEHRANDRRRRPFRCPAHRWTRAGAGTDDGRGPGVGTRVGSRRE